MMELRWYAIILKNEKSFCNNVTIFYFVYIQHTIPQYYNMRKHPIHSENRISCVITISCLSPMNAQLLFQCRFWSCHQTINKVLTCEWHGALGALQPYKVVFNWAVSRLVCAVCLVSMVPCESITFSLSLILNLSLTQIQPFQTLMLHFQILMPLYLMISV